MIGERQQRLALALALEAGASATIEDFARCTVALAPTLVECEVASYNEITREGARYIEVEPRDAISPPLWGTFERLVQEHPLVRHYGETFDGRARRISDVIDRDDFHRLDIYNQFFSKLGLEHQVAVTLPPFNEAVIGLALSRGGPADFTTRDCDVLNVLRPHLARAHAHVIQVQEMSQRMAALARGADALEEGIVLLNGETVEHMSEPARALLLEFFGSAGAERLPHPVTQALAAAGGAEARIDRGRRRLTLRPVGGPALGVLVLTTSSLPMHGYDLTPRELEMLASVAEGRTDGEIGAQLGISARTVERHLQNAYEKLGVHTRAGAVARVFNPLASWPTGPLVDQRPS